MLKRIKKELKRDLSQWLWDIQNELNIFKDIETFKLTENEIIKDTILTRNDRTNLIELMKQLNFLN